MYGYDPEEDGEIVNSRIMLFNANTRLMCPYCGITSNHHLLSDPFYYQYTLSPFLAPHMVCHHTCHRCGYKDDEGPGFTDSGNYESEETDGIQDWEQEIMELEDELAVLREKLANGKRRWAMLWEVDTDET